MTPRFAKSGSLPLYIELFHISGCGFGSPKWRHFLESGGKAKSQALNSEMKRIGDSTNKAFLSDMEACLSMAV